VGTRERKAFSAAGSEHFALPQSFPQLRDVDVYLGFLDRGAEAVRVASAATATLARVPGVQALLTAGVGRVVKGSTGGPDAAVRSRTGSHVVAEARDADGDLVARVALEGANIYDFTAAMLAWSAHAAAAGRLRVTGAAGPVAAFGLDALADGVRAAGLQRI
jgi:short subunit dehydrogenase-like uncharacterized protein